MKLLVKILLFVFVALVANVKVTIATITFPHIQQATNSNLFHKRITKTEFKFSENEWTNCYQNEKDLVNYRN